MRQGATRDMRPMGVSKSTLDSAIAGVTAWAQASVDWVAFASAGQEEDLRYPASGINPPGAASDPVRNNTTGLLEFSAVTVNVIAGVAQLPHARKADTAIEPHIHVLSTESPVSPNDVAVWRLQYRCYNIGAARPAAYTTISANHTLAAHSGGQPIHQLLRFADIPGSGLARSACVEWVLSRLANDPADTYPGVVTLLEFDLHYFADQIGR